MKIELPLQTVVSKIPANNKILALIVIVTNLVVTKNSTQQSIRRIKVYFWIWNHYQFYLEDIFELTVS